MLGAWTKRVARALLPDSLYRWISVRRRRWGAQPRVGGVDWGSLRRTEPFSRVFGEERGLSVDRYYIERFLGTHAPDVRGRVLEFGDDSYTRRFGGDRVVRSDVLHAVEGNPRASLVADLARAEDLPSEAFDCVICTQTLGCIYDLRPAVATLHRILKPAGTILVTVPGISQISRYDMDQWGEYWRFTTLAVRRLFEELFPPDRIEVEAHGNVVASIAFLHGLAAEELASHELDRSDPDYQLLIALRAVKPDAGESR